MGRLTGIGRYTLNLLTRLNDHPEVEALGAFNGVKVVPFMALRRTNPAAVPAGYAERLSHLIRVHVPFARTVAKRARNELFTRSARAGSWDIYHETNYVARPFRGKTVTTVHDLGFMRFPGLTPRDQMSWLNGGFRRSIERSDRIICVSRFTCDELLALCPWADAGRVVAVHLGVGPEYRPAQSEDASAHEARTRLNLPERFILSVGALEPRKNLLGLLRAYSLLPAALRRDHPLILAGADGFDRTPCDAEIRNARNAGQVRNLGYVAEWLMPPLLRAATVLCYPSLYEGFGLPPLEAAACGTPVVCSRAASLPEVMGEAALFVTPDAPEAIAAGLQRVLEDTALRDSLRRAGPRRAARFTWEKCAEETVAVYRSIR